MTLGHAQCLVNKDLPASHLTAAKVLDFMPRLLDLSAYTQVKMEDAPDL